MTCYAVRLRTRGGEFRVKTRNHELMRPASIKIDGRFAVEDDPDVTVDHIAGVGKMINPA